MKLVVTGSSGWLGRFLVPMLRAAGHSVTGLDAVAAPETDLVGSVADPAAVAAAVRPGTDGVVHAGALHKPDIARHGVQDFIDTNVTGTRLLLEAAHSAGASRFVFTSTTSLMISEAVRAEEGERAVWIDEDFGPLEPRNIYGVTKLAAEGLCRVFQRTHGLPCVALRTSRFFPEDDDTHREPGGANLKVNELLHRRLTVEDAALAHLLALERAPQIGFAALIVSAPTPFTRVDTRDLMQDASGVIGRLFPDAAGLYARAGWQLPRRIGRVYDASRAERVLGFRARTGFAEALDALRHGRPSPVIHDPAYGSPLAAARAAARG